jgi:hypothetical protein
MPDTHPADEFVQQLKDLFDGDALKQSIRNAWDRATGQKPKPASTDNPVADAQTKAADDKAVADATKSFVTADAARRIRAGSKSGN